MRMLGLETRVCYVDDIERKQRNTGPLSIKLLCSACDVLVIWKSIVLPLYF